MIERKTLRLLLAIWPVVLGAIFILAINRLENWLMPVVEDFTITKMERQGDKLMVSGYMRKVRACTFVGIGVTGMTEKDEIGLRISFSDSQYRNVTRPQGSQDWGPWALVLPVSPEVLAIRLDAVHDCHPAWPSRTRLASFPVVKAQPADTLPPQ